VSECKPLVDGGGDEQAEVSAKGGLGGSGRGGGGGDGEGGTDGGGGGDGWLRDADIYMSERVMLTTPQQARLAPYYNRELARRDEPRIPGRGLHSLTFRLKISTFHGIRWVHDVPPA